MDFQSSFSEIQRLGVSISVEFMVMYAPGLYCSVSVFWLPHCPLEWLQNRLHMNTNTQKVAVNI